MSDIYLQITETPTVVTLSAPVVSGALASTVTVANTVTVALDSNSLSALENVTVTVGAAITGTVTVSNFPATQPVSIASVTVGNTVTIAGTVTANNSTLTNVLQYDGSHYFLKVGGVATTGGTSFPVYVAGTVTANPTGTQTIAGTVTANLAPQAKGPIVEIDSSIPADPKYMAVVGGIYGAGEYRAIELGGNGEIIVGSLPAISGTVTVGNTVTIAGTVTANPTGTQTIAGSVTIGAGTAQIGSVTASVTNSVTVGAIVGPIGGSVFKGGSQSEDAIRVLPYFSQSGSANYNELSTNNPLPIAGTVTVGNSVTIASLPALVAGTAQIGSVTASISNSVTIGSLPAISGTVTANTFALQGTAVTTSNFTSTTASTVLANYNATREVLTIFNEGAGNLHICAGATCTTIAYQVRLSAGDYYEVPNHQTTITHSAVFATAGTARVTEVI